jgi:hypothetical protein
VIDELKQSLDQNCPNCGNPVLENLNHRELNFPIDVETSLNHDFTLKANQVSEQEVLFKPATVFRGLLSRVQEVDRYIGGLKQDWFTIFYGSQYSKQLAERYCFSAQLPLDNGGLNSTAVFIDAGNSFDPYFVASLARQHFRDPAEALDKVIISRAFTCYELANLLSDLPSILDTYEAGLVVISDIFTPFNEDIKRGEAEAITYHLKRRITELCSSRKIVCIATCCHRNGVLEPLIFPQADVKVEFRERNRLLHASLTKHPYNSNTDFLVKQKSRVLTLDSFPLECEAVG